jgi:hypothetical protein
LISFSSLEKFSAPFALKIFTCVVTTFPFGSEVQSPEPSCFVR